MSDALDRLAAAHGVVWHYWDGAGREQLAPPETRRAVLAALGVAAQTEAGVAAALAALDDRPRLPSWVVADADAPVQVTLPGVAEWQLTLEDGSTQAGQADGAVTLGPLPVGYHTLCAYGVCIPVLCAPRSLPPVPRSWGVMAPLYGLRPVGEGGIGDYADLAEAARVLGAQGAAFLGINPVHAGFAEDGSAFSPYSPSSRERFDIKHIAVPGEDVPPDGELIDYSRALAAKRIALDAAFDAFQAAGGDAGFDAWVAKEGPTLQTFAVHQALSEVHGAYWPDWPAALRDAESGAVRVFAQSHGARVRAHAWRQWMAEQQLHATQRAARDAGMRFGLYLDLAVGTHPAGAEVWADPDLFAKGVSQGAPPDAFAPDAQVWNLAPMLPQVLAARGFQPLARILRRQLRFAGILRIDHILGFERGFWVPDGLPGAYVMMPKAALLAVLRIEAVRAGAVIVGEDLGVVPEGLRDDLACSGLPGCRVAMFERHWNGDGSFVAPEHYPAMAMASFGSHDLPLWAGWRAGRDIDWRLKVGDITPDEAEAQRCRRIEEVAAFDRATGDDSGALAAMVDVLGRSASCLAAVQIEDILGAVEQPNLPGTIRDHPNWRRRLGKSPAAFAADTALTQTAAIMARHGRQGGPA